MRYKFVFILSVCCLMTINILYAAQQHINVTIDQRIELLAIVQFISEFEEPYRLVTQFDFEYKQDVIKHFSPYKNHPAVKMRAQMCSFGYMFDAPPASMLYLSDPPELKLLLPLPEKLQQRTGEQESFNKFVSALRDFAKESDFQSFFESQKQTYQDIIANVNSKMHGHDYIGTLEAYYGLKQHSFNIILVPLYLSGGFGINVKGPNDTTDIYFVSGSMGTDKNLPTFGGEDALRHLAWHEFGHSFVDLEKNDFNKKISAYASLYKPIEKRMSRQGYGTWENCVEEHLVRAITTRLAYIHRGKQAGDDALISEKSRGYFYVEALCKALEHYEGQRQKYPTFYDFYPELINTFSQLADMKLPADFYRMPFCGSFESVMTDENPIVFILPTNESDKTVQKNIHEYVTTFTKQIFIFKDSPVITDKEALTRDLSSNCIIVFGTSTGNLWLAKYMSSLPFKIDEEKIVTDTTFTGTNLRFITTWPNPDNPYKGIVINTAQRAEDITGINDIQPVFNQSPINYAVARGTDILKTGVYLKQGDKWTFE